MSNTISLALLVENATDDELRVITTVLQRANAKKAVVVTLRTTGNRRYVVSQEDEHLFEGVDGLIDKDDNPLAGAWFGGQWLRKLGNVDEMYRSLCGYELTKVTRLDRKKIWG